MLSIKRLLEKIVPKSCLACDRFGTGGQYLCHECAEKIVFGEGAKDLSSVQENFKQQVQIDTDLYLDGIEALTVFSTPVSQLIKSLKYDGVESLANVTGEWLWWWSHVPWEIDFVCHVPLHWSRFCERGFNQSQLMTKVYSDLSKTIHLPLLERTKVTQNQASSNVTARQSQIMGIFSVRDKYLVTGSKSFNNKSICCGKSILVIDDVMTTGNTFNECARALKMAGASRVYGLALAHGS